MTTKHHHPLYQRNARLRRAQVRDTWRTGGEVICRRCGHPIHPEQRFDVGHIDDDAPPILANLGIEHSRCNRSAGGRKGATITNKLRSLPANEVTSWAI